MKAFQLALIVALLSLPVSAVSARAEIARQAVAGWTDHAPAIDGKLDDPAWVGARELGGFLLLEPNPRRPEALTYVRVLTDGRALYVGFRCVEPRIDRIKVEKRERDAKPWLDDCVETVIDPTNDRRQMRHLIVNAAGSAYDALATVTGPETFTEDAAWNGDWEVAASKGKGEWYAEWRIPFETIGVSLDKSRCLGANFARERVGARVELSSWSPSRGQFANPACLGELILPSPDGSYLSVDFPKLEKAFLGPQAISCTVLNHSGSAVQARQVCRIAGPEESTGKSEPFTIDARGERKVSSPIDLKKPGSYELTWRLEDAATGRGLYQAARRFEVKPEIELTESLYQLYHKRACVTISLSLEPSRLRGAEVEARLIRQGSPQPVAQKKLRTHFTEPSRIDFDLSRQPNGTYVVEAAVTVGNAELASAVSRPIPYDPEPEVGFTRDGFLQVDGKPYFPVGIYTIQSKTGDHDACLKEAREAGFNTTVYYAWGLSDVTPLLDAAARHGIKAFVYPTSPYDVRGGKATPESITKDVQARMKHPALLGWYLVDEPEGIGKSNVTIVRDLYQTVKLTDTRHPCSLVIMSPRAAANYGACADVVWIDPYPVPNRPVTYVSDCVGGAVRAVEKGKPVWAVPQAFDWNVWHTGKVDKVFRPTPEEERCMTYLAIVHGAKGIIYWAHTASRYYIHNYPGHWEAVKKLAGELRDLSPVLLTVDSKRKVELSSRTAPIDTMVKELGRWIYLFAVNRDPEACSASFTVSGLSASGEADILFENRRVTLSGGAWQDEFKPLAAHVYRLPAR